VDSIAFQGKKEEIGRMKKKKQSAKTGYSFWQTVIQAFEIKNNPFPLNKAISAGICAALPVLLGVLLGNFQNGLLGGLGGFTFLYMFGEPYVQRGKKLFWVAIGISAVVGLGTLLAPYPVMFSLMLGFIGAFVTFIFGTLKLPGPAAIFFVLCYAITSAMPIDPSLALERSFFVLLGGAFAWLVAMSGGFFNARKLEIHPVKALYGELANLVQAHGEDEETFSEARRLTLDKIETARDKLMAGHTKHPSKSFKRLYLLYEQANVIYGEVLRLHAKDHRHLPKTFAEAIKNISNNIGKKKKAEKILLDDFHEDEDLLAAEILKTQDILAGENTQEVHDVHITKTPVKTLFSERLHKNSIVFLSASKYGIILFIVALVAFSFNFDRSYWIPGSCAAVMLGTTVLTTFHRAIQRTIGSIVGIIIAILILSFEPSGLAIALFIFLLTFGAETFIVRNYALAALFFTPNAIFIAENSTQIFNFGYFAQTRITDVIVGSAIGLAGAYFVARRSASSRLPHLISKTIRSQMQFMVQLFSEKGDSIDLEKNSEVRKMRTNLSNLNLVYRTALGEVPNNKEKLETLWPIIFSLGQLGYLLETAAKEENRAVLRDQDLSQLVFILEMMAQSVKAEGPLAIREIPEIEGFPQIHREMEYLQSSLQLEKESGEKKTALT